MREHVCLGTEGERPTGGGGINSKFPFAISSYFPPSHQLRVQDVVLTGLLLSYVKET